MSERSQTHSEVALMFWASVLNILGGVALLASLGVWYMSGFQGYGIVATGIGAAVSAFVSSALLRAVADILRVLKRSAGLSYAGTFGDDQPTARRGVKFPGG